MNLEELQKKINEALKAKDDTRLSTLRMLSAAVKNAEIEKKEALSEAEFLEVAKKEAKKRKDAIEAYTKAGEQERAGQEKAELEILEEFLPAEMNDSEIEKIVDEVVSGMDPTSLKLRGAGMGQVMGAVMGKVQGQASGDRVSAIVKSKLQKAS